MVEFYAYAADCRLTGQINLADVRLSDQLNSDDEIVLREVSVQDLGDGHTVALPELVVGRDEMCAILATGPRGDPARRLVTTSTRVAVAVGPYEIEGWVHGPRAGDPFGAILKRGTWVPLTDAWVTYQLAGQPMRDRVETLLVNRHLMSTFRPL